MDTTALQKKHNELFGNSNLLTVRSPGRINLIGEHTDYNDGFVFPAAIDKAIWFTASKNDKGLFRFYSMDYSQSFKMNIDDLSKSNVAWANYLLGVANQFKKMGHQLSGVDVVFGGDIPIGAGLSSSAAVETGFAMILNELFGYDEPNMEMVKMAQKAEHEYAGVMCGIMDQFAIVFGKKQQAIKLDCRTLDYEYANLNLTGYQIILVDTKVKHSLASSAYNQRRQECEAGVKILKKYNPDIIALRDVPLDLLHEHKNEMEGAVYHRCKYVVEENNRVIEAFDTLHQGNIRRLGEMMMETHAGLRDDFEVSCKELDVLFDFAQNYNGVIGSRMMGGGFGGCTINIVAQSEVERFKLDISNHYKQITGNKAAVYEVAIEDGTVVAVE